MHERSRVGRAAGAAHLPRIARTPVAESNRRCGATRAEAVQFLGDRHGGGRNPAWLKMDGGALRSEPPDQESLSRLEHGRPPCAAALLAPMTFFFLSHNAGSQRSRDSL